MAGIRVEKDLQAGPTRRVARCPLALKLVRARDRGRVRALERMRSEKGVDNDNSAVIRISCRNREAGVGSRLAGAVRALVEALERFGQPSLRTAGALLIAGFALSSCAQQPSAPTASGHYHGHEHFAEGKY